MTRGGARRTRSGVGLLTMKPWASAAAATSADSGRDRSRPTSRPRPRTSGTRSSAASPARRRSPMAVACSSRPSFSMVSRTARAAAQATGLPPKVVPWLPGCSRVAASPRRDAGADRDAAAQALGHGDDVGVGHRSGEPLAGAADAGLHLVEPEQRAVVAGDLAGGGEVVGGRDDHARLALDRFEDDGRGLVGDGLRERGLVAVRHEGDVAGQRLERRAVRLLRRQRERAHGAAVEGALGGDQVGTAGAPGELEGRLVGLGAGVGEEDPCRRRRRATAAVRPARPAARW